MVTRSTSDRLLRGIADNGQIRFVFVNAPNTLSTGIVMHDCDPVAAMIFGQSLLCALLSVPLMKGNQRTTLRWEYQGPVGKVICEADHTGAVRGIPQNASLFGAAKSEDELFGETGTVSIVRSDSETGKILSTGTCRAGMFDIPDDFALLLCISDQNETEVVTGVRFRADPDAPVEIARAVMLQAMPGADLERFEKIRQMLRTTEVRSLILNDALLPEEMLSRLFIFCGCGGDPEFFDAGAPVYSCFCERKKMLGSIKTLAKADLQHLFNDRDEIELVCQFCRKKYKLKQDECER